MKKKIVSIVCASVVAVLVATVVVLGFVKTNKNTFVTRPDAVYVMNIRTKSNAGGYGAAVFEDLVGRKSEEVSKMFNNFNSAFEHSVLEGIVSNQNDMAMTPQFVHTAAGAERMSRNFDSSTKITIDDSAIILVIIKKIISSPSAFIMPSISGRTFSLISASSSALISGCIFL